MVNSSQNQPGYKNALALLLLLSTSIRLLLASGLELGNDEVYYVLYARFPDWSHFDHPLLVGLTIQLFSLNLLLESEVFIRLGAVIFGTLNTWLIFLTAKNLYNERTAWYSALLYTSSLYCFIISGTFILPDSPQSFFWWLSLFLFSRIYKKEDLDRAGKMDLVHLGIMVGLGMLSKYTTVFIWLALSYFIIRYRRSWLKEIPLYLALTSTLVLLIPIIYWNWQNDFISFSFHSGRVSGASFEFNHNYLIQEIMGSVFYNNPINWILILLGVIFVLKGKSEKREESSFLLSLALPIIFLFIYFSLTRRTLPHWSAPAYSTLILLAAHRLDEKISLKTRYPKVIIAGLSLVGVIVFMGYSQVQFGLINFQKLEKMGIKADDPTLDLFGFDQVKDKMALMLEEDTLSGKMDNPVLVGNYWFPLANFDHYVAGPLNLKTFGIGGLSEIHKYAWTNRERGGFEEGMDAYYLTTTRDFRSPEGNISNYFETTSRRDTINIMRSGRKVKEVYVYRLNNLNRIPSDPLGIID